MRGIVRRGHGHRMDRDHDVQTTRSIKRFGLLENLDEDIYPWISKTEISRVNDIIFNWRAGSFQYNTSPTVQHEGRYGL